MPEGAEHSEARHSRAEKGGEGGLFSSLLQQDGSQKLHFLDPSAASMTLYGSLYGLF